MTRVSPADDRRPHAWVLCARLGQHTKPYLWRQIVAMETVRPTVVTWRYIEQEGAERAFDVLELPFEVEPTDGPNRWKVRARNAVRGNFFASVGEEERHIDRLLTEDRPDVIVILPWNLRAEILEQLSYAKEWGVRFVVPIPSVERIDTK